MSDSPLHQQVLAVLRTERGVATSALLQARLGVSQATVSRALAPLLRQGLVLKVGSARSQAYLLPRPVRGLDATVPISRVSADGAVAPLGRIIPIHGESRYWVEETDGQRQAYDSLPWYMDDMRPQGFLGRRFFKAHPELELGPDLARWSDDDVLRALCAAGEDMPGNLIVGRRSLERYNANLTTPIQHGVEDYPRLANEAMLGTPSGSSAGGEQPKFGATRDGRHFLVKFSPPDNSAVSCRLRDLLLCEHLALQTLQAHQIPAARSTLHMLQGRVFLEVERFDRTDCGRIGMVSLLAYDSEHIGQIDNWARTAERMQSRGLLNANDTRRLRVLEGFGRLIANSDRHYGNISLVRVGSTWRLAPTYDMLPMQFAPIGGELVEQAFDPSRLQPTAETVDVWPKARELAAVFWRAVSAEKRITSDFREMATRFAGTI